MALTPTQQLTQQIQGCKTLFKYDFGGPNYDADMTTTLVAYLVGMGVSDVRDIVEESTLLAIDGVTPAAGSDVGAGLVDRWTGAAIVLPQKDYPAMGGMPGCTAGFSVQWTTDGFPVFLPGFVFHTDGVLANFLSGIAPILPIIEIALAVFLPGAGLALGALLVGAEYAAAYPILVTVLGNLCINTVFDGGDVAAAAKSACIGGIASGVGGFTGDQANSALVGKAAGAATGAYLTHGNITQAVAGALVTAGVSNIGGLVANNPTLAAGAVTPPSNAPIIQPAALPVSTQASQSMDPTLDFSNIDATVNADVAASAYDAAAAGGLTVDLSTVQTAIADTALPMTSQTNGASASTTADAGTTMTPAFMPEGASGGSYDNTAFGGASPNGGGNSATAASTNGSSSMTDALGNNWETIIAGIGAAAIAAVKLLPAYLKAGSPAAVPATTTVAANGTRTTINANGTETVTTSSGQTTTTQVPTGVPYVQTDGSIVTNNGNGTYTTVTPTGQSTTSSYPAGLPAAGAASGSVSSTTLLILAAAAAAYFLMGSK